MSNRETHPSSVTSTHTPGYLTGHLAPVLDEIDAVLPPELIGRRLRNGPNRGPARTPATGSPGTGCCTPCACGTVARSGTARTRWVRTAHSTAARGVPAGFHGSWIED
jgi:carotenoid cleavage dioxygenase